MRGGGEGVGVLSGTSGPGVRISAVSEQGVLRTPGDRPGLTALADDGRPIENGPQPQYAPKDQKTPTSSSDTETNPSSSNRSMPLRYSPVVNRCALVP